MPENSALPENSNMTDNSITPPYGSVHVGPAATDIPVGPAARDVPVGPAARDQFVAEAGQVIPSRATNTDWPIARATPGINLRAEQMASNTNPAQRAGIGGTLVDTMGVRGNLIDYHF